MKLSPHVIILIMNKFLKRSLLILGVILAVLATVIAVAFIKINIKTANILDDISEIYSNEKYQKPLLIENLDPIKQDISCGYAVIEMFAKWAGKSDITEESLYDSYGSVVTSTGDSFEKEMNKQFPEYNTIMYKYLKNTELVDKVYESLEKGIPVPFEWAAKIEDEWTLHYSLIIGMNIQNDSITILNPYGYKEEISIKEFLDRTSFEAYENMPLFLKFGFAFGIFEKNTIFIASSK